MLSPPIPQPKPPPRLYAKLHRQRSDHNLLAAFRLAVWLRAKGHCEACGRWCRHSSELHPQRGEIDHINPRSLSKAGKYDLANGRLLCLACHLKRHGR